jgi:hypothetical protein
MKAAIVLNLIMFTLFSTPLFAATSLQCETAARNEVTTNEKLAQGSNEVTLTVESEYLDRGLENYRIKSSISEYVYVIQYSFVQNSETCQIWSLQVTSDSKP